MSPRSDFPNKRARLDSQLHADSVSSSTSGPPDPQCICHQYSDKMVILELGEQTINVRRSTLERHSNFLKQSLQNRDSEDRKTKVLMKGAECNYVIPISGVEPQDVKNLLKALDSAFDYFFEPLSFSDLASITRAAHPLGFTSVLRFTTHKLSELWPRSVEHVTSEPSPHAIETIALARQCDLPQLLRPAFYDVVRTRTQTNEDSMGNIKAGPDGFGTLSNADRVRVLKARTILQREWMAGVKCPPPSALKCNHFPEPSVLNSGDVKDTPSAGPPCVSKSSNSELWITHVLESSLYEEGTDDPLRGFGQLMHINWKEMGYCFNCIETRTVLWKEKREKLWNDLNVWLGVGL